MYVFLLCMYADENCAKGFLIIAELLIEIDCFTNWNCLASLSCILTSSVEQNVNYF